MPESKKGNKYVLTVICVCSRYSEVIPIPNMLSKKMVEALTTDFCRIGYVSEIQTDLGKNFT